MEAHLKLAVLISGRGSNLQAFIDAAATAAFPAKIVRVISNEPDAGGLERAAAAGISTAVVPHRDHPDRESFESSLSEEIRNSGAELVVLAGFMRLLTATFVEEWRDRIINIHPSLLPAFKGLHTHERALEVGVRYTGCTVHYVRPEMDEGPIIEQEIERVDHSMDPEQLTAVGRDVECVALARAVKWHAEHRILLNGHKTVVFK